MRVVITGAGGQLGSELKLAPANGFEVLALTRAQCDIANEAEVRRIFEAFRPHAVLNAGAYTKVDKAERETEEAYAVNAHAVEVLARSAEGVRAHLVHVSTDYVFDGEIDNPYQPDSATHPLNVYGQSKRAGEELALRYASATIVRTGWLYSARGENFVSTMLRVMRSGRDVRVVNDQIGAPTAARELSRALWWYASHPELKGIHHWSNRGCCSWFDFACAIQKIGLELGLLNDPVNISPINSAEYGALAARPKYSVLGMSDPGIDGWPKASSWHVALYGTLVEMTALLLAGHLVL